MVSPGAFVSVTYLSVPLHLDGQYLKQLPRSGTQDSVLEISTKSHIFLHQSYKSVGFHEDDYTAIETHSLTHKRSPNRWNR